VTAPIKAPFPWFGGKSKVAAEVWARFGAVQNYVEPFFGSGAVLLGRPQPLSGSETINDADGMVSNFWRAVQADPEAVAHWADWPVNETDLHARHYWLVTEGRARLSVLGDPAAYDAQVAGWWVWGLCSWIGSGWCAGEGPWQWDGAEWVSSAGRGINRQLPHLGDAGRGINRQLPHLGSAGQGILDQFSALCDRLRGVRVAHGDWSRVCGDSVTWRHGMTAVFLDPPYSNEERTAGIYAEDCGDVAALARAWAIQAGKRPDMRIALCGYESEHAMPSDWSVHAWKAHGGYGSQGNDRGRANAAREVIWFSPACIGPAQPGLFA
jgi:DNA adenine methylase